MLDLVYGQDYIDLFAIDVAFRCARCCSEYISQRLPSNVRYRLIVVILAVRKRGLIIRA